jgi:hypothetical protein
MNAKTDDDRETGEPATVMNSDRRPSWVRQRRRPLVRRVGGHIETRLAFSVLSLSTMGLSAAAILAVVGIVGLFVNLAQGEVMRALAFFLVSLALVAVAAGFGFGMGFIGLPFVGDWFLEWPSHALGWGMGVAGCVFLALLLFLTPIPAYGSVLLALASVLGASYLLAYALWVTPPVSPGTWRRERRR